VNVPQVYVSVIAKNDEGVRKEFMVMFMESIEFLKIDTANYQDMQLRMCYL
jgi:hypothetical protein